MFANKISDIILGTGSYENVKSGNTVSITGDGGNAWGYFGPSYKKLAPRLVTYTPYAEKLEELNKLKEEVYNLKVYYELSKINGPTLVSGVGGSSVVSEYASKVLAEKNHIITRNTEPRDFKYIDINLYKNVLTCSYSGNNYGVDFTHTFIVPADVPSGAKFLYWEREDDPSIKYYPDSEDQYVFHIDYEEFAGKDVKVVVNAVYDIKTSIELEEITSDVSKVPNPMGGTATLTIDYSEKLSNGLLMATTKTYDAIVNEDGTVVFEDVKLENPGTYKYTVSYGGYHYGVLKFRLIFIIA